MNEKLERKDQREMRILLGSLASLCLIFSIPLLFNWFQLYDTYEEQIEISRLERMGSDYIKFYNAFLGEIFHARNESAQVINSGKGLGSLAEKNSLKAFPIRFKEIHDQIFVEKVFGTDVLRVYSQFKESPMEIEANLNHKENLTEGSVSQSFQVSETINRYISLVGDRSNLILDADIDSYYLAYALTNLSPKMAGLLLEMNSVIQDRNGTPQDKINSKKEILRITQIQRKLLEDLQTAVIRSSEIQADKGYSVARLELLEAFDNLRVVTRGLSSNAEFSSNYLQQDKSIVSQQLKELDDIQSKLNSFNKVAEKQLERMLETRISELKFKQTNSVLLSFGLWLLSIAVAALTFILVWNRRKSLTAIINQQQSSLEQSAKMATLGEVAAGIGHEIATPLTIISSTASTYFSRLPDELRNTPNARMADERIQRMVRRIHQIILSMKSLVYQNEAQPPEVFDLRDAISDVKLLTHNRALKATCDLNFELPESEAYILGVESELVQVLVNLVNNAIDATTSVESRSVTIKLDSFADQIKVSVQDSGPGVPRSHREKIFEPLFTTKAAGKGTGLGLSICKRLIAKNQGELHLSDQAGGACFIITLPSAARLLKSA